MRQPAAEKRFTVACPMPRLAPVKMMVFRSPACVGLREGGRWLGMGEVLEKGPHLIIESRGRKCDLPFGALSTDRIAGLEKMVRRS